MEYRYKIGDIVAVRSDLTRKKCYYMHSGSKSGWEPGTMSSMEKHRGEVHTVVGYNYGYYLIDEPENLCWSDDMFEPIQNECVCKSLL